MLTFGPIPSRRLGRSLGINNIPPKICSYSCIYCQLGRTLRMKIEPQTFYSPEHIFEQVEKKVNQSREKEESIDYLTFVPDGEPTLDINLGETIRLIKPLGIKIAVITNSSLLDKRKVRDNLKEVDLVSLKVDSVEESIWKKINRPHHHLVLTDILDGMVKFAHSFKGEIITETMLVKGINDDSKDIEQVADFLARINPARAYLSIPIRPPAEQGVKATSEEVMNQSYNILQKRIAQVEHLIGYEGNAFAFTGEAEEDILSITSVHPMREEALKVFLKRAKPDWSLVLELLKQGKLVETEYEGHKFYLRKFQI